VSDQELMELALAARERSYCPYSHFAVGAALLTAEGRVYTGCNVENAAYGPSNCAERTAIFKAVSEGERAFAAIAIAGGAEGAAPDSYTTPCGVCRQVMREFCADSFRILCGRSPEDYREYTLGDLFPESFGPDDLEGIPD